MGVNRNVEKKNPPRSGVTNRATLRNMPHGSENQSSRPPRCRPLEKLPKPLRFLALMGLRVAFIDVSLLARTGVSEGSASGLRPLGLLARPVERQITNNRGGHILTNIGVWSPDGQWMMKDDEGVAQLWTVSPLGGPMAQLTHNPQSIASAFTWSPTGKFIAHVMDNSVCATDTDTGKTTRLTERAEDVTAPRPEACVFSPDGNQIAYVRPVWMKNAFFNQVFVVSFGR
jgi:hypothetical protein